MKYIKFDTYQKTYKTQSLWDFTDVHISIKETACTQTP